jgi:hypothetical protein
LRRAWPVLRDYTMITAGAPLAALAVDFFLDPNNVVNGEIIGGAIAAFQRSDCHPSTDFVMLNEVEHLVE